MSNAARRALSALKNGNVSSDEDADEDYYNEDEQDNYQDVDDFVIQDEDVGYKASAHQKQRNSRQNNNQSNRKRNQKTQSYNISRKRHKKNKKTQPTQATQTKKKQQTMNTFFKQSSKAHSQTRPRNTINRSRISQLKNTKKPTQNTKNNDDFMANILTNMNDSSDEDSDNNTFETEPQTQINMNPTPDTIQTHHTQTQIPHTQKESVEPPKKKMKYDTLVSKPPKKSEKMEMSDEDTDINPPITDTNNAMDFQMNNDCSNSNIDSKQNSVDFQQSENTDNYPQYQQGFVSFYWFDAYEDSVRKPGQIYLFGKTLNHSTHKWQSICVLISNIQRTIYVLPRLKNGETDIEKGERMPFMEVYKELQNKRQQLDISKLAMKPISKKYCFRERKHGIPSEATYLKCMYSFDDGYPFLGKGYASGKTYQKIFGVRSTALELFILDKQIMGPCWLRLKYCKPHRIVSWCDREVMCDDSDNISVLSSNYPSPPFKTLSLSFQTVLNSKKEHEIAVISGFIDSCVFVEQNKIHKNERKSQTNYFTFIRKIGKNPFPYDLEKELATKNYALQNLKTFGTELELLNFLTVRIQQIDPDVIIGHKLYDFLLDVLLHRMDKLGMKHWSKIGRLRRGKIPFFGGRLVRKYLGCGRLFVDTFISSQEFLSAQKTYTLGHLCAEMLGVTNRNSYNSADIRQKWFEGGKGLCEVIMHCCNDSNLVSQLCHKLQTLALTKELTQLCGNLWSRSLLSQRAERNEWLLLHEFERNGFIIPDKLTKKEKIAQGIIKGNHSKNKGRKREKAQYSGGLVLEPIKGLYDKYVICLDFNSLYPSIIQEYNLCFTSTQHWKYERNKNTDTPPSEFKMEEMRSEIASEMGILPRVIGVLLDRRSAVKKLLKKSKSPADKARFDIQQKALKLVANSMYGCLGFSFSRFYCEPIAALITALGREALLKAKAMSESIDGLKVIYGDTDSIFIYTDTTDLKQARSFATAIKRKVNKTYSKMYLELDYVFSKMLLLRKKKYAANKVVSFNPVSLKQEIKGLDLVRRDWSIISKEVGNAVMDIILSTDTDKYGCSDDIILGITELLGEYRKLFEANQIELGKFEITKKLTKAPKDYPDASKQSHVMVAVQMQKALGMSVSVGSFIEYIICTQNRDKTMKNKGIAQRAYHRKEIEKSMESGNGITPLLIDREWYLAQQILPPIGRYCAPIEGTDMGHLAHALGLDTAKFAHLKSKTMKGTDSDDIDDQILRITNPLRKYAQICAPLKIKCHHCQCTFDFGGVFNFHKMDCKCGLVCPTQGCKGLICGNAQQREVAMNKMKNGIALQVWHFIYKYYAREYRCAEIECGYQTQQLTLLCNDGNDCVCPKIGCSAKMRETYSAQQLFDQLRYFAFLFDRAENEKLLKARQAQQKDNKLLQQTKLRKDYEIVFDNMHKWIKAHILSKSDYYFIDSKVIFKYLV